MQSYYEMSMAEMGHMRAIVRPYVTKDLFNGPYKNGIFRTAEILRKRFKWTNSQTESAINAFLMESFAFVYGDDYPIHRDRLEMTNSQDFLNLLLWLHNSNDQIASMIHLQCLNHERGGKRVYELSEGLAQALYHTELRGLQAEHLELPYPNIYITVPPALDLKMYTSGGGEQKVGGVFISDDPSGVWIPPTVHAKIVSIGETQLVKASDNIPYEQRKPCRTWHVLLVSEDVIDPDGKMNCSLFHASLRFREGLSLEEVVTNTLRHYGMSISRSMHEQWPKTAAFIFNTLIYATNSDLEPEIAERNPEAAKLWEKVKSMPQSRKRTNLEDKAQNLSRRHYVLGSHITVDRSRKGAIGPGGTGKPLTVRVLVSGHWRKVRCGKGRTERRLTWIQPFWRGPEIGNAATKIHRLV